MKYSAKYLPVEGKIKEGDIFLENGILYRLLCIRQEDWVICTLNLQKQFADVCKNPKKAKLFLCSRDIQVGDNFEDITGKGKLIASKDTVYAEISTGNLAGKRLLRSELHDPFKAIGEISSQATWVKEGDEFDESEINKQWYDDSGVDNPWTDYIPLWDWFELPLEFRRCQIKGPCGHFH